MELSKQLLTLVEKTQIFYLVKEIALLTPNDGNAIGNGLYSEQWQCHCITPPLINVFSCHWQWSVLRTMAMPLLFLFR
jgi:hypothetical protein